MAPLQGATLGERQRYYNKIVKEAIDKQHTDIPEINYTLDDVDNMARIDLAADRRDLDYILKVLQCDDMLYVTRAIKMSKWLVADERYHHVIQPRNLHKNVFPHMTTTAINKLLRNIRTNLKDETLARHFFLYVNEKSPAQALKWLPLCPIKLIHRIVRNQYTELTPKLIKRLSRKSLHVIKIIITAPYRFRTHNALEASLFLLKSRTEDYFDILESSPECYRVSFNANYTEFIMKKCPQRIIDNFRFYRQYIHIKTFVKFIKKEEIKDLLMSNNDLNWLTFENLKHFLEKLPRNDVLEFLKNLFGLSDADFVNKDCSDTTALFYALDRKQNTDFECYYCEFKYIYRWYEFAPFEIAFNDLRKFIYAESSPAVRHSLLIVLLACGNRDLTYAKTVISYYHDKHINEPYIHKIHFVNKALTQFDVFKLNKDLWSILDNLFHSLEVYIESDNKVQLCIKNIIIYNVINDQPVHKIVEHKFLFDSLKTFKSKLNFVEQDKLFKYLYNLLFTKLNNENLGNESSFNKAINILKDMWTLLKDWNKESFHHKYITKNIAKLCTINKQNSWDIDMTHLYQMVKPYQRQLIENSIDLYPSVNVCVNILKHNPNLLKHNAKKLNNLCCNVNVSLNKFLSKLRIYWADSLSPEWSVKYIKLLEKNTGHKALVRGIFILLPRIEAVEFFKKYVPPDNKIHWSEADELELNLRRHIARSMHLVRPQLKTDVILWYAKGDYLQYSLLAINTIYSNLRSTDLNKHIQALLNAPVSLQKHGITLAFKKMKIEDLKSISISVWKSTRNSSIRSIIFTSLFNLMCKKRKPLAIYEIWEIISTFIDDLSHNEDTIIYKTLGRIQHVPKNIAGQFYMKSYLFLKSLSPETGREDILWNLIIYAEKYIDCLESDFVENNLLESVHDILTKELSVRFGDNRSVVYRKIVTAYLLCSQNEDIQLKKYQKLVAPVLEKFSVEWSNGEETTSLKVFDKILDGIGHQLDRFVFELGMVMPIKMYTLIYDTIMKVAKLENYVVVTHWKLFITYLNFMSKKKSEIGEITWSEFRGRSENVFSSMCVIQYRKDLKKYFRSIYLLFAKAMQQIFHDFNIEGEILINTLKSLLKCQETEVYLLCLEFCNSNPWITETDLHTIYTKIYKHSSEEIKMHFIRLFGNCYKNVSDDEDIDEEE